MCCCLRNKPTTNNQPTNIPNHTYHHTKWLTHSHIHSCSHSQQQQQSMSSCNSPYAICRSTTVHQFLDIDFQFGTAKSTPKKPLSLLPMCTNSSRTKKGTKLYFQFKCHMPDSVSLPTVHIYLRCDDRWVHQLKLPLTRDTAKKDNRYFIELDSRKISTKDDLPWFRLNVERWGIEHVYYYYGLVNRGNRTSRSEDYLRPLFGANVDLNSVTMAEIHQRLRDDGVQQQQSHATTVSSVVMMSAEHDFMTRRAATEYDNSNVISIGSSFPLFFFQQQALVSCVPPVFQFNFDVAHAATVFSLSVNVVEGNTGNSVSVLGKRASSTLYDTLALGADSPAVAPSEQEEPAPKLLKSDPTVTQVTAAHADDYSSYLIEVD